MIITGYGVFVAFILFSVAFASAALILSWIVQPKNPTKIKESTYECGMNTFGDSRIQFGIKYYVYAILFIIFEIEAIFLFPFAVIYKQLKLFALVEVLIFILILVIGLVYAWKKDALEWK